MDIWQIDVTLTAAEPPAVEELGRLAAQSLARACSDAACLGALPPPALRARIGRFVKDGSGSADRLPIGAVYEATMRCNLHCEFCYVGDLLNIEGEWREELTLDALRDARSRTARASRST